MFGNKLKVSLYRYNPEEDKFPYMKNYVIDKPERDIMVLDLLHLLKEEDQSISYRRSCREGVCGSDGMNINGKNGLACITPTGQQGQQGQPPSQGRAVLPEMKIKKQTTSYKEAIPTTKKSFNLNQDASMWISGYGFC